MFGRQPDIRTRMAAAGLFLAALLVLVACVSGRYPTLPTAADYGATCDQLIADYVEADARYRNRKLLSQTTDVSMSVGTVVAVAATGPLAPGVVLGTMAIRRMKGDMGTGEKARSREEIRSLMVRQGCTQADIEIARERADSSDETDETDEASTEIEPETRVSHAPEGIVPATLGEHTPISPAELPQVSLEPSFSMEGAEAAIEEAEPAAPVAASAEPASAPATAFAPPRLRR